MRRWVIVGLVSLSSFAAGCASSGRLSAIALSNILIVREEHNLVGPVIQHFETETLLPYFPRLVEIVRAHGSEVYAIPNLGPTMAAVGYNNEGLELWGYNTGRGKIFLEGTLSVDEAFATLVHELGHSLQPDELDGTAEGQVYAEALSFLVCEPLGLDLTNASFPYLTTFEKRHEIIQRYSKQLDAQAGEILAELRR